MALKNKDSVNYPQSIDNGHGEHLTFEGIERDAEGELVRISATVQPGSGPPMHTHFHQSECLEVVEGEIWYQIDGQQPGVLGPGERVVFEPGQAHTFKARGEQPAQCRGWVRPPDNNVYFLSQIYASAARESDGGRPNDMDVAFLLGRYGREYDIHEIPRFVKAVVFPVLRLLGKLNGRFRRFADAPPAVH